MVRKGKLDMRDKEIIRNLQVRGWPTTTTELAKATDMSWNTVRTHLKELKSHGLVISVKRPKKTLWQINYDAL